MSSKPGPKYKYPWEKWLNTKQTKTLIKGVDFDCEPHNLMQQVRRNAKRLNVDVSVSVAGYSVVIRPGE